MPECTFVFAITCDSADAIKGDAIMLAVKKSIVGCIRFFSFEGKQSYTMACSFVITNFAIGDLVGGLFGDGAGVVVVLVSATVA